MQFPDKDIVIQMIHLLSSDNSHVYPGSYTLDVGILPEGQTVLIEMHPWCCIGLYGYMFNTALPYYYAEGVRWYIEENTPRLFMEEQ